MNNNQRKSEILEYLSSFESVSLNSILFVLLIISPPLKEEQTLSHFLFMPVMTGSAANNFINWENYLIAIKPDPLTISLRTDPSREIRQGSSILKKSSTE